MKNFYLIIAFLCSIAFYANGQEYLRVSGEPKTPAQEQNLTIPASGILRSVDNINDSFETYQDFVLNFSPWTTVDVDQSGTYGIDGVEFPNKYEPMAYMIFNPSQTSPPMTNPAIQPHTGAKFAASFASDGAVNNDWLITPPISLGTNSSLTLWVKSFTSQWGLERYRIGVSTTNTNPASFTIISGTGFLTAPATAWEEKTFSLNDFNGQTVYIGIHCVSDDAFIFMVDDVVVTTEAATINPPTNLTANLNSGNGQVTLNWSHQAKSSELDWETNSWTDRSFQHFRIYRNGTQLTTTTNLNYVDQLPQYGTYNYTVTAIYTAGESTPAGPASVNWESSGGETATLTGLVTDATNGNPIAGALVTIAGLSANTDANGNYTIENIPAAALTADFTANVTQGPAPLTVNFTDLSNASAHTVVCSKEGYATYTNTQVNIPEGQTLTLNISLSPQLSGDEIRFVLNWGAEPRDLDSHLLTPEIEGQTWHVWYSFLGNATSAPYAALDYDVTTGYGPETMTIYQRFDGTYKFYVYNYTGSPDIVTSNAVVQIYNEAGLIHTVQIPTTGTGRYWYVADVNGATGQITIKSIIQEGPPDGRSFEMPEKPVQDEGASMRNIISWNWNFGDGTTSTDQNPVKTYSTPGTYNVSLTVSDGTNQHTTTKTNYITATGSTGTGSLTGLVTDAQNGNPVPNALVSVAGLSTYTDANGNYTIDNIPAGVLTANFSASTTSGIAPLTVNFFDQSTENSHTVTCEKEGYLTYSNNQVIIPQGASLTLNISLSQQLAEGNMRFVLNWGAEPRDLDSHLNTPEIGGQTHHIYYSNKGSATAAPFALLDYDVTTGFGPETVTIYELYPGVYQYYVYNYTGSPEITTSNAVVQIYNVNGLQHTLQIPTSGTGLYWYVCDVNGSTGAITIRNVIQENAPGSQRHDMPEKPESPFPVLERTIVSWSWNFGDGSNSTQQNPVKTYQNPGAYTVSLTVSDGTNQSTETKTAYIVAGGASLYERPETALNIFPVPAQAVLHIESEVMMEKIMVTDLTGKEIMTFHENSRNHTINTTGLKQGAYLLFVQTANGQLVRKFTVK